MNSSKSQVAAGLSLQLTAHSRIQSADSKDAAPSLKSCNEKTSPSLLTQFGNIGLRTHMTWKGSNWAKKHTMELNYGVALATRAVGNPHEGYSVNHERDLT